MAADAGGESPIAEWLTAPARYAMRGYLPAVLTTLAAALLSLFLLPALYLSGASVALVTLRRGPTAGLAVAAGSSLALGAMLLLAYGTPAQLAVYALALWLPVLALAVVLRSSVSLPYTLATAAAMAALAVLGAHLLVDDVVGFWLGWLQSLVPALAPGADHPQGEALEALARMLAQVMTGMVASGVMLTAVLSLLLGRWWQARLYNPGGFGQEFRSLRLGRSIAGLALAVLAAALLTHGEPARIALELLLVLSGLFFLAGLALAHWLAARSTRGNGWLIALYGVLLVPVSGVLASLGALQTLLALLTQLASLGLVTAGFADAWLDIRQRMTPSRPD
jgi:hypothetical protein